MIVFVFSQSDALRGYHGNHNKILHVLWKFLNMGYNIVYDTVMPLFGNIE